MLDISRAVIEGGALSIVFLILMISTLAYNPRVWLQDYPMDIQQMALPQTPSEKKKLRVIGSFTFLFALVPFVISLMLDGDQITYWETFFHFYIVFSIVSFAADLIILDWIVFCLITPKFIIIPGTEGAKGYKDYMFHFIGFLKGAVILGVFSLILAGLRVALTYL
ncbi:hypothetical protein [Paenibacillus faecalis]|uniref:hypothetical protein n=1 Tax=Paenibacillus faecalis TaxID=2079532 RepID=UPI000D1121FD|nr:hypothetical protein [Paenibacillus faecalis]